MLLSHQALPHAKGSVGEKNKKEWFSQKGPWGRLLLHYQALPHAKGGVGAITKRSALHRRVSEACL